MDNDNIPSEDKTTKSRTLFDATPFEIFWRNFLAGIARTLGSIFLYIIFLFLLSYISYLFVFPKLTPIVDNFTKLFP